MLSEFYYQTYLVIEVPKVLYANFQGGKKGNHSLISLFSLQLEIIEHCCSSILQPPAAKIFWDYDLLGGGGPTYLDWELPSAKGFFLADISYYITKAKMHLWLNMGPA